MVYNISRHFNNSNIVNTNTVEVLENKNELTFEEALIKASNLIYQLIKLEN